MAMHPLGAFITATARERGVKLAELGRKGDLTRSRMSQFVNDPIKALPGRPTLEGLAAALGVSLPVVIGLALDSMSLPWPQPVDGTADQWPPVVLDNWEDPMIRSIWLSPGLPAQVRLGMIATGLRARGAEPDGQAKPRGPSRRAANGDGGAGTSPGKQDLAPTTPAGSRPAGSGSP